MDNKSHIKKIALAIFKDKKVLLAREHNDPKVFTMFGGTVEGNETALECAHREAMEEGGVDIDETFFTYLHTVKGQAYGNPDKIVTIDVYETRLLGDPTPSAEVAEIAYFDSTIDHTRLSPLGREIFQWLKEKGYIN